ncbi:MAG: helix-turn-helix transcriptional regulator [Ruminococcaceae bacterium]|nr:helix-turn-helix transcriptional regulator [Oscillospiraceae bacterium]
MTTIGQNIRKLRKERQMTQEELAAQLNISAQAVSKWEMETCSPDISQIVPLAALFGVSADVLFGISPDSMEKEIEETRKYCDALETSNEDALETWMKLYERYPHNNFIRFEIAKTHEYCASPDDKEDYIRHNQKAAEFYEKVLDESADNDLRSKTLEALHHIYSERLFDSENALRIANMGGDWGTLKAEMLSKTDGYEKKNYWCQQVFQYYGEGMAWALVRMRFPDTQTKIFAYETAEKILDLTYLGDKAWISYVYMNLYTHLAKCYVTVENYEKMYEVLEKWYETALFEDNLPLGEHRYENNPFMTEIVYNHDLAYTHHNRDYILCHIGDHVFDSVRDCEKFKAYIEKVNAMPGIEYPFGGVDFED